MKIGDIVKTPGVGGMFSSLPAIVVKKDAHSVTVHTGTAELMFAPEDIQPHGSIKLGRSYGNASGRRFRVAMFAGVNGAYKEVHVCTRERDALGEETRVFEVRKLAFKALLQQDFR